MGIRGRILLLALGIGVPLALVGGFALVRMWNTARAQLDDSVRQQAELAATAFERWVDAERQPLTAIAFATSNPAQPDADDRLRYVVQSRSHWIDITVTDSQGRSLSREPRNREPPPSALIQYLISQTQQRHAWTLVTDRTRDDARPIFAIAFPTNAGGIVIARIDGAAIDEIFKDIQLTDNGVISILDAQGQVLYRKSVPPASLPTDVSSSPLFAALGESRTAVVELQSRVDQIVRVYGLARSGRTDFVVAVGVPAATLHEPMRRQLTRYLFFSVLALACAVFAAILLQRSIVRPVDRLRIAATALGEGDLSARAPIGAGGEIGELGETFNRMATQIKEREDRLTELDRLKSEFVSNVSHELRTPLTTIKTLTHVLQKTEPDAAEKHEYLNTIAAECDRQIQLITNLLDVARIESGNFSVELTPTDVRDCIMESVRIERHAAELRGHQLITELPDRPVAALTNDTILQRIICTLIDNAIKYTSEPSAIRIGLRAKHHDIAITVSDKGQGISSDDVPHVFERFYRGHAAGNGKPNADSDAAQTGVGLGLYTAQSLAAQLQGRIVVESEADVGSTFTIHLPRLNDHEPLTGEEKL